MLAPNLPAIDRVSPGRRPSGSAAGYHTWSNLLFVHWRVPADEVRPLIPPQLTLDTWAGDAWIGLVPFRLEGVRPWWAPPCPGLSCFCETNVRTYVHFKGRDPGVWFFSLDASNSVAVRLARKRWHLPYFRAQMQFTWTGDRLVYSTRRLWPGAAGAGCSISVSVGQLGDSTNPGLETCENGLAVPGTLDHFLVERYVLYASGPGGRLMSGRVHHAPYRLRSATILDLQQDLLTANGITPREKHCHAAFSDGVSVDIFPLRGEW